MRSRRAIWVGVFVLMLLAAVVMLAACEHEHTFNESWATDDENHWHAANCGHDEKSDIAPHEFDAEGKCTVCGLQLDAFKVYFYDGETLVKDITYYPNDLDIDEPQVPEHEGYTGHWEEYTLGLKTYTDVNAVYEPNSYTVTFDVNGGDPLDVDSQTVVYNSADVQLPVPTRHGYRFVGWYIDDDTQLTYSGANVDRWNIASNVSLRAEWLIGYYSLHITKDLDGGDVTYPHLSSAPEYGSVVTLTAVTRAGFTFVGWYIDGEQVADTIEFDYTVDEENYITAKWIVCPITLENTNEQAGTLGGLENTILGKPTTLTATPFDGYVFVGWYSGDQCLSEQADYEVPVTEDAASYTARWDYAHFPLHFVYDSAVGEFTDEPPTYYTIEGLTLPEIVGNSGHKCIGWQAEDGRVLQDIPVNNIGKLTLTAIWSGEHVFGEDGACTLCKYVRPYTMNSSHSYLDFGMYPQTKVADTALQSMLNAEIDNKVPTIEDANGWTSYDYRYTAMWYIDVEYTGSGNEGRYRGVYFTSYRRYVSVGYGDESNTSQDNNGYYINTVYWFKWEPIQWKILTQEDGTALLLASKILDSQSYYIHYLTDTPPKRTVNGESVYSTNYKYSDIRAWLNDTFYNEAFDKVCKRNVLVTEVDNSQTSFDDYRSGNVDYACENTFDHVFLLSWQDVHNKNYGFKEAEGSTDYIDPLRQRTGTDYALCQGLEKLSNSYARWWLRTPQYYNYIYAVGATGGMETESHLNYTCRGVVPGITIEL